MKEWKFAVLVFLFTMGLIGWAKYFDAKQEVEGIQENFRSLTDDRNNTLNDLGNCRRLKDRYKNALDATPVCTGAVARIEFLEGQLESCTRAYAEEKHDRLFCENAFEDVSPYCSESMDNFVIDGLREELRRIIDDYNVLLEQYHEVRWERDKLQSTWEPCAMLYDCAFGEVGWIGPDRVICDVMGNTTYDEARMDCYSDRNCSSCLQMTGGDLGHCYAFAYYP